MQSMKEVEDACSCLTAKWGEARPLVGVICGSGWGALAEQLEDSISFSYDEIPGMSPTTVIGHEGRLHLCSVGNGHAIIFQGRRHFYEGEGWGPVRFPVYLAHQLGVQTLLLTNAAGGIRSSFKTGDMMALSDHLNFMPGNPLIGPVENQGIPRFPDQTEVYCPRIRKLLLKSAEEQHARIHEGVYVALSGPAFETPAEIRAFSGMGADAVGMSTVPEAMLANALGMKVGGLSCISNLAAGIASHKLSHEDVERATKTALPKMKATVLSFLQTLLS